jgi:hypothetical protein
MLGILALSFIFIDAQAHRYQKHVNFRPIDDWVSINPFGIGVPWETAYVGGDMKGNHYWMWIDSLSGAFTGNEYEYSGSVKEKLLRDGSIEVTIKLFAKEIYIEIVRALYDESGYPIWTMDFFGDNGEFVLTGNMDYLFKLVFVLDSEYEGYYGDDFPWWLYEGSPAGAYRPSGTRELGGEMPFFEDICYIPEEMGIHLKSMMLIGIGEGITYEPGYYYWMFPELPTPTGETAKALVFHNVKFDQDYPLIGGYGDPFGMYAANWGDFWPFGSTGFSSNLIYVH